MKTLIFDWGDTIMRDFFLEGPMWNWKKVAWIPNAEAALIELSKEYNLIIATSADHSDTDDMIKALKMIGADSYFNHFYSQKELGFKKPDPRFFKSILVKSANKASNCIMIGNSYEKDIEGASAANIKTIFFNEKRIPGEFVKADIQIYNLANLRAAVAEIF